MLPEWELEPVTELPSRGVPRQRRPARAGHRHQAQRRPRDRHGHDPAKSLIEAKDGLSFLDVLARQVIELRERSGARLPLVLMDSFPTRATRSRPVRAQRARVRPAARLPAAQGAEDPVDDLTPVEWPDDPSLEWCPPGHGDLYTALLTSGMLEALLDGGYRYAFVSNSDNLGAVLDPRILAWVARKRLPFAMEVTERTEADRKGGHLAPARRPLRAARDGADAEGGPRRAAGHLAPPLREHEQPVGRPRGAARRPRRALGVSACR